MDERRRKRVSVTPLRKTNGDPPRDVLRQAIAELQKARDAVAERDAALDRARAHLRGIDGKLAEAATAAEEARQEMADAIVEGEGLPAPTAIRAARAAELDLADQRAAIEASRGRIRDGWQAALSEVERAERKVDIAIRGVLEESGYALIEKVREAHLRFLMLKGALTAVAVRFDTWSELSKAAERAGIFSDQIAAEAGVAQRAWERAIEALKADADAPLPEPGG
jgi:chromosome segregation ATPase